MRHRCVYALVSHKQNKMNVNEIISNLKLNRFNQYSCTFFSELFKTEVELTIDVDRKPNQKLTDNTIQTIHDFLEWDNQKLIEIESGIWQNCLNCNADDRYSFDKGQTWIETKLEDNLLKYNITNKEDALKQAKIVGVYISNNPGVPGKIISISCETSWDPEHGINFTYVDSKLREIA